MLPKSCIAFGLLLAAAVNVQAGLFGFMSKEKEGNNEQAAAATAEDSQTESLVGMYIIKSSGKPNLCIDDMNSVGPGEDGFHLWECNEYNVNQHFSYDPSTQQIRNPHKDLCLDDGGAFEAGQTTLTYWYCDPNNINQRFEFNQEEYMFFNPHKNLCLDDGGGMYPGDSKFHLWECNGNVNQKFEIERLA
jgi:hypothetical protein